MVTDKGTDNIPRLCAAFYLEYAEYIVKLELEIDIDGNIISLVCMGNGQWIIRVVIR